MITGIEQYPILDFIVRGITCLALLCLLLVIILKNERR